jgi:hypothetical protein
MPVLVRLKAVLSVSVYLTFWLTSPLPSDTLRPHPTGRGSRFRF